MFQILLLLGSLSVSIRASLAAPLMKGDCNQTCGGVTIPFPFGIGRGCFLDEWYEIVCQESGKGTVPILNKANLKVFNISLPNYDAGTHGMIRVSLPIIYSPNGTCGNNRSFTPVSLKQSHFIFSESMNFFAAVGCNICALLDDTMSAIKGCKSICEKDENAMGNITSCSGSDGCCHTTITSDLQAFNVTFLPEKSTVLNKCAYAFLGERSWFAPLTIDFNQLMEKGSFPAVLEWGIAKSSQAASEIYKNGSISSDSYNCSNVSFNLAYLKNMPFLQCSCSKGFTGNPYIKDGCKDVDECQGASNRCPGRNCVNRRGSFSCVERSKTVKSLLIGFGANLGVLLLFLLLWLFSNFMKKRKEIKLKQRYFKQNGGLLLQQQLHLYENNLDQSKLFNVKDLEKATDNFNKNRILGEGGQGTVYKGMLANGGIVAIKKSKAIDKGKVEQFINEIAILSQINHRNVVKLLGCCLETESPLLVYEFITNGNLFRYLHDSLVSWGTRLQIATEVAEALSYLHSSASIPIYHRDIKSTNILLDDKYCAKVADFGTSKSLSLYQTHVTTAIQGTFGYLDPEYFQSCQFTDKSDVYSFGVVLVELLTGRKPVPLLGDEDEGNLASDFLLSMDKSCLYQIVDTQVLKQGKEEGIVAFANLARRCLNLHGKKRPTMKEVASELERIRKLENAAISHGDTQEKKILGSILDRYARVDDHRRKRRTSNRAFSSLLKQVPYFLTKEAGTRMFQILLLLGSLLLHEQGSQAAPLVKGNCTQTCGGITIPFPFGIGAGCFLHDWYEIVCQESSNGTVPILNKAKLRVLNITLPDSDGNTNGMINVSLPIIYSSNESCGGNGSFAPVSLKGSQFVFSQSRNVFTAVGCNIRALMDDTESAIIGCKSSCGADNGVVRNVTCSGSDGCCQTTITSVLQAFSVDFQPYNGTAGYNECNYAFLGDRSLFMPATTDFDELRASGHFAAVLEWGIAESSEPALEIHNYGYISGDSYDCATVDFNLGYRVAMPFLQCSCSRGFTGNPYFKHGCEDVDECEHSSRLCPGKKCVNRRGSYACVEGSKTSKFVLIGLGACLGAILLLLLLWLLYKFMKKRKEIKLKERFFKQNGGLLLQQQLHSSESNVDKSKLFSSKDLEKATDDFNKNRILGQGGQGTVYKGMLADGKIVAIKKSKAINKGKVEQFINEIAILSQINHRNVVKLLGCCLETQTPLLVYEFVSNGTLFQYLHAPNEEFLVSWDTRLQIATEVAGALSYLHSSASIPIYHRDIKSTNILLDDKFRAKVADFGTSKSVTLDQTHVTTRVQGTFGYLDPEYFQSSQFTDKSDVYSFGVVLVELLTGRKPISFLGDDEEINLASYFLLSMDKNCLWDIVDVEVLKQGKKEGIVAFASLARKCLNLHGKMRPPMKEVAIELERIRKLENPALKDEHIQEKNEMRTHWESVVCPDIIALSDRQPLISSAPL